MKGIAKQVFYSCRQATLLVERQLIGHLSLQQRLRLRVHIDMCPNCARYRQQSHFMHQLLSRHPMLRSTLQPDATALATLKARILQQLSAG